MGKKNCLSVQALVKQFSYAGEQREILKGITQQFVQGMSYALMGASGTGKSTFMHLLAGLDQSTHGMVSYNGSSLTQLSAQQRARAVGFVFQTPVLIVELSVLENVVLAGLLGGKSQRESDLLARELLEAVGLGYAGTWQAGQLSGGQKQRVALARALMNRPAFLLADELTGNLDHETGALLIKLLFELKRSWNMGLIVSSHNPEIAAMMDLVFILKDGNLVRSYDHYLGRRAYEPSDRT